MILRYAAESKLCYLIDNKPLVLIGTISFSLYLVHMPIIVFVRMWALGEPGIISYFVMIGLSFLLSVGFYYAFERPRFSWWLIIIMWIGALVLCRAGRVTHGFRDYLQYGSNWDMPTYSDLDLCPVNELEKDLPFDFFPLYHGVFRISNRMDIYPTFHEHRIMAMGDKSGRPTCLLIGDSHAAHAYPGLDTVLKQEGISGAYLSGYICPLSQWDHDKKRKHSADAPQEIALMNWLQAHPEITHVIIGQRWWIRIEENTEEAVESMRAFIMKLRSIGKIPVLIGPTPECPTKALALHFDKIYRLKGISTKDIEEKTPICTREAYDNLHREALLVLRKMQEDGLCFLLEPLSTVGSGGEFRSIQDGELMMVDINHISAGFSIRLISQLLPSLRKALDSKP